MALPPRCDCTSLIRRGCRDILRNCICEQPRVRGFGFEIHPVAVIAGLVMAMLLVNTIRNVYLSFIGSKAMSGAFNTCLEFYRRELERQRAAASQPVWQLVTALLIISWLTRSAFVKFSANSALLLFVLMAGGGLILLLAFRKFQARGVQEEIDALDRFEDESQAPN